MSKSSDRRLAGSRQAAKYLNNQVNKDIAKGAITPIKTVSTTNTNSKSCKTVLRTGGGKSWEDSTLLEWDPSHFRLFVGNLGDDANDALLAESFRYPSVTKVKVPVDKLGKNKGYGFVAFSDAEDYFNAFKEMNGKYVGLHPIQLKRAETKVTAGKVSKTTKNKRR